MEPQVGLTPPAAAWHTVKPSLTLPANARPVIPGPTPAIPNSNLARFQNIATSDVSFWDNNPTKAAALRSLFGITDQTINPVTILRDPNGTLYQLPIYTITYTLGATPIGKCPAGSAVTYRTTDPGFFITNPVIASTDAASPLTGTIARLETSTLLSRRYCAGSPRARRFTTMV